MDLAGPAEREAKLVADALLAESRGRFDFPQLLHNIFLRALFDISTGEQLVGHRISPFDSSREAIEFFEPRLDCLETPEVVFGSRGRFEVLDGFSEIDGLQLLLVLFESQLELCSLLGADDQSLKPSSRVRDQLLQLEVAPDWLVY